MNEPLSPPDLCSRIRAVIGEWRTRIDSGDFDAPEGVDTAIGALCASIAALPKEEAKQYTDLLQELHDEVAALGQAMEQSRASLKRELKNVTLHHKANVAYQTSESMGKAGKKPDEGA